MQSERKIKKPLAVMLFSLLLFFSLMQEGCGKHGEEQEDILINGTGEAFTEEGIVYSRGDVMYYADAATGIWTALCDTPGCTHGREFGEDSEQPCGARLSSFSFISGALIRNKTLYFFQLNGSVFSWELVRAEVNGKNRQVIAELEEVQYLMTVLYFDDYVAAVFENSDYNKREAGSALFDHREKPQIRIALISLTDGAVIWIEEREDYEPWIYYLCAEGDCLYYSYQYYDDNWAEARAQKEGEELTEWYDTHKKEEFWEYQITTGERRLVAELTGQNICYAISDGQGYYRKDGREEYVCDLKTGESTLLFQAEGIRISQVDGERIVFGTDNAESEEGFCYYYYDRKTGEITEIGVLQELYTLYSCSGSSFYIFTEENEKLGYAVIDREDFYAGRFEKRRMLFTYE